jgi:uncharacterized protein
MESYDTLSTMSNQEVWMKIIFEFGHPAHVHNFKHVIRALERDGHQIKIAASRKDVALALLDAYGLEYTIIYDNLKPGRLQKALMFIKGVINLYRLALGFGPDLFVSRLSPISGLVSRLMRKPHIGLDDTDHARFEHMLAGMTTDVILTPECFRQDLGKKQVRFNGFKELAYIHPAYFKPDSSVLETHGLSSVDKFIFLRLISWGASHDVGHHGIMDRQGLVHELERYGRVLISSEGPLEDPLKKYEVKVPPEQLHNILYHASLCIGEGSTTVVEAALLGTPSIYISSLAGLIGNFEILEKKYGLVFCYDNDKAMIKKAKDLLNDSGSRKELRNKLDRFYNETIDLTAFMVWFIEHYPESYQKIKAEPAVQYSIIDGA